MAVKYITIPIIEKKDVKRFESKVLKGSEDACWLWQAYCDDDGYGTFKLKGNTFRASRIAYVIANGVDPKEYLVCHTCDNPPCVNPKHLWLGTLKANTDDKCDKKRQPFGLKNGRHTKPESTARGSRVNTSKLSEQQVIEIIDRLKKGENQTDIANRYGITRQSVFGIKHNKNWKHLPR